MTDNIERTVAIVIAPVAQECYQHDHDLIRFDDGIVCKACSDVAAAAANHGQDPEAAVVAFRAWTPPEEQA